MKHAQSTKTPSIKPANAAQHDTAQHSAQHEVVQHSGIQHSAIPHSAPEYAKPQLEYAPSEEARVSSLSLPNTQSSSALKGKHDRRTDGEPVIDEMPYYMPKELRALTQQQRSPATSAALSFYATTDNLVSSRTHSKKQTSDDNLSGAGTLIMIHSASGGIGTSVLTALIAWSLKLRQYECAILDLDLNAGGLDILLGQESAPGLRWSQIRAPLGSIDGQSLCQELPRWQGMPLLASDSWQHSPAQWWEVLAAVRALLQCKQIVIADAGTQYPKHLQQFDTSDGMHTLNSMQSGNDLPVPTARHSTQSRAKHMRQQEEVETLPSQLQTQAQTVVHVVAVEMSVLGLARARGMIHAWQHCSDPTIAREWRNPVLIGKIPHVSRSLLVQSQDAQAYIQHPITAQFVQHRVLRNSLNAGLGIRNIPRQYRRSLQAVCSEIMQRIPDEGQ